MEKYHLIATTEFGLEAVVKRECLKLNFKNIRSSNGKVEFDGDEHTIAMANVHLRSAERVLIKLAEFKATSFEDLYQGVRKVDISNILPEDAEFPVNGRSLKSILHSVPDCQSIVKKALVDNMSDLYGKKWFKEDGDRFIFEISLFKNLASLTLDTTGEGLHKRGYRKIASKAPIRETIANAMLDLSFWNPDRPLFDPFCGSATILIEAAMRVRNIAPGIKRNFDSMNWDFVGKDIYNEVKKKALAHINFDKNLDILGFEIDRKTVEIARENIAFMGLEDDIKVVCRDMRKVGLRDNFGVVITNPPYGKRIMENENLSKLYEDFGKIMMKYPTWSTYVITSDMDFESHFGKRADRKRKLYNGRIETNLYQFYGLDPKDFL